VKLMQVALSDQEGSVIFYKDELSGATGSVRRGVDAFGSIHHHHKPRQVSVRSVTMDSIADPQADPDFIKIDVEGAELMFSMGLRSYSNARARLSFLSATRTKLMWAHFWQGMATCFLISSR
jgi:FkbM family methyltransferase